MSEMETAVLEIMRGGIRKFDNFIDQIPDEFFGLQDSSKEELKKVFRQNWGSNPFQTAKQILVVSNECLCVNNVHARSRDMKKRSQANTTERLHILFIKPAMRAERISSFV